MKRHHWNCLAVSVSAAPPSPHLFWWMWQLRKTESNLYTDLCCCFFECDSVNNTNHLESFQFWFAPLSYVVLNQTYMMVVFLPLSWVFCTGSWVWWSNISKQILKTKTNMHKIKSSQPPRPCLKCLDISVSVAVSDTENFYSRVPVVFPLL